MSWYNPNRLVKAFCPSDRAPRTSGRRAGGGRSAAERGRLSDAAVDVLRAMGAAGRPLDAAEMYPSLEGPWSSGGKRMVVRHLVSKGYVARQGRMYELTDAGREALHGVDSEGARLHRAEQGQDADVGDGEVPGQDACGRA